jgi:FkbM family methyltransferase
MRQSRLAATASWLAARLPTWALLGLYRLGPVTRLLRSLLNRSVPPGLTEVTVAGGQLAGTRVLLDLREEKDLWLGSYEPFVLEAIARFTRPGMTVYDVGAHIGYVTLFLAQAIGPQGRVVAFEPLPANQERLRKNLELNGLGDRVQVVAAAVGAATARQRFTVHSSPSMGKLVASDGSPGGEVVDLEVDVVALDDFASESGTRPALVKIDIEGGEQNALRGMRRLLQQARPSLLLELHDAPAAGGLVAELRQAGYQIHQIKPPYDPIPSMEGLGRKAYVLGLPVSAAREVGGA